MAKRIAVVLGIAVLAGVVLFFVLRGKPARDAPNRPPFAWRHLQQSVAKQAAPSAQVEQGEAVPLKMLDRAALKQPTQPPPATGGIKSSDVPEDNGMHWFLLAAELMPGMDPNLREVEDNILEFGWRDDSRLADQIERCREAFEAARKGLEVGNAMLPPADPHDPTPYQPRWRDLCRMMTLDALMRASRGNYDAALGGFSEILSFIVESSRGGNFIGHNIAAAMQRSAAIQLCKTLQSPAMSAQQCRTAMERLAALDANAPGAADAFSVDVDMMEYHFNKHKASPDNLHNSMKNWGDGVKQFAETATPEQCIEVYRQHVDKTRQAVPLFEAPIYEFDDAAFQNLVAGDIMSQNTLPMYRGMLNTEALGRVFRRGSILVAAIEAYHRDKGAYPANLDALASSVSAELPNDPFTGAPFGYVQQGAGYLLYSAGINMLDDGGKGKPWDAKQDDCVIVRRE
ncbi:MAG TPA: hypothetical protein VMZ06_03215 [Candidatus Bathyarchaeia archaeon]|nr:hypothetical protein [Candidatus Bathyarchaeia archaeon]